jgi:hypothetical protein
MLSFKFKISILDSQAPGEASGPLRKNLPVPIWIRSTAFFKWSKGVKEAGAVTAVGGHRYPPQVSNRKLIKDDRKTFFPESSVVLESDCLSVRPAPPPGVWGGGGIND